MGLVEMFDPIIVQAKKPILVEIKQKDKTKPIEVYLNYDPRMARIKVVEEPVLRERGFKPADTSMTTWLGSYKGHQAQIYFPADYPAKPLQWYWQQTPFGFSNVIRGNQLCIEALLVQGKWAPDLTAETVFEALDSHPYFRVR